MIAILLGSLALFSSKSSLNVDEKIKKNDLSIAFFSFLNKNTKGYEEYRCAKDSTILVKIPAGEFWMGSRPSYGEEDEYPQHKVHLEEYYIAKYEVTNEQFEKFIAETGYRTDAEENGYGLVYNGYRWESRACVNWRYYYSKSRERHPVVMISWNDAKAYCDWAGLRLPTEAEWEKAARGSDERKYPWGNEWSPSKCAALGTSIGLLRSKPGYMDMGGGHGTTPVGHFAYGVSPYGCFDMAGNAWEWCADRYDSCYYSLGEHCNPTGPLAGEYHVLRGGSWLAASWNCRSAFRIWSTPSFQRSIYGFRVAYSP
jgi:formylglycine-generating enzyme required for sulfatase activity